MPLTNADISELIYWANKHGYRISTKKHPKEAARWNDWKRKYRTVVWLK